MTSTHTGHGKSSWDHIIELKALINTKSVLPNQMGSLASWRVKEALSLEQILKHLTQVKYCMLITSTTPGRKPNQHGLRRKRMGMGEGNGMKIGHFTPESWSVSPSPVCKAKQGPLRVTTQQKVPGTGYKGDTRHTHSTPHGKISPERPYWCQ